MAGRPDRRRQILQAAERMFTSRRFHEVRMEDVAREAAVGKGTLYKHFADKDDLFFQMATSGFDEMCDVLQRAVTEDAPFVRQLVSACEEIARFFDQRRQLFVMLQSEDARVVLHSDRMRERWIGHHDKLVGAMAAVISRGIGDGQVRSDYPADVLALSLLALLGGTRMHHMGRTPEEIPSCASLIELFMHGACRGAEGPPKREQDDLDKQEGIR